MTKELKEKFAKELCEHLGAPESKIEIFMLYEYRQMILPLVVRDRKNNYSLGRLAIKYKLARESIRNILNKCSLVE